MPTRRALITYAGAVVFAAFMLWLWQLLVDYHVLSPVFVASPSRIIEALISNGSVWDALAATLARLIPAWVLAAFLGTAIGAAIGLAPDIGVYIRPTLEFFRQLPAAVLIPPAILLLGPSEQMMVTVIVLGALWPILISTIHGFITIAPRLREVAASLEMTWLDYFLKLALPAALPDIVAGVRTSLAIALFLAVVVEMKAGSSGLGRFILQAQQSFRAPDLYAGIVLLGALGFVLNLLPSLAERRVLRWHAPPA